MRLNKSPTLTAAVAFVIEALLCSALMAQTSASPPQPAPTPSQQPPSQQPQSAAVQSAPTSQTGAQSPAPQQQSTVQPTGAPASSPAPVQPTTTPQSQVAPADASSAAAQPAPETLNQSSAPTASQWLEMTRRLDAAEAELTALRLAKNNPPAMSAPPGGVIQASAQIPAPQAAGIGDVDTEARINALEAAAKAAKDVKYPLVRLSGFAQLDDALNSQSPNNRATLGDMFDGIGFRRTRLQALGSLTEFTRYSIEMDFAIAGRPSFLDVWGEQSNLPYFGTIRIGQFRQPTSMDGLTSIRHLDFLERSAPFQALDPFRRVGIMSYRVSEDEMSTLAYSVYATGFTFWNNVTLTSQYQTLGDTRFATQIGDTGGVSTAIRATHLLYYDEPAEGRYLLHIGGGYNFSEIGGEGTTGSFAKTYQSRSIPEYFVGDPISAFADTGGTPAVVDTGRILTRNFHYVHTELAGNYGAAHFQTEFLADFVNQFGGPTLSYYGAYLQGGYFLTGESAGYNKQTGVMDYNVKPYSDFFGLGNKGMCGWGAWEVAFRWSYLNLSDLPNPANVVGATSPVINPSVTGNPPSPNPGSVNLSTLALNWWWNQYTRVQFNWIHVMLENEFHGSSYSDSFVTRFQIEF
jgi:phosphate-selective porin OprO and OprP